MSTGRLRRTFASLLPTLLGFGLAFFAQSERLPLVAAVGLAIGLAPLAPLAGLGGRRTVRFVTRWDDTRTWYVGDTVTLTLETTNTSARTTPVVTVTPASGGLALAAFTVPALLPAETATVTQSVLLTARRGPAALTQSVRSHHRLVDTRGAAGGPPLPTGLQLPGVRPRPVPPPAHLMDQLSRPTDEGRACGRRGAGAPLSLRQFVSGDSISSVHWRSTARAGSPVVMEREQPLSGLLVLLVALTGEGEAWEGAVARAAGLVQAAGTAGVPVEVLAAAPALAPTGSLSQDTLQDWLAGLGPAGAPDETLVRAAASRAAGGLVAVLSDQAWVGGAVAAAGGPTLSVLDVLRTPW